MVVEKEMTKCGGNFKEITAVVKRGEEDKTVERKIRLWRG